MLIIKTPSNTTRLPCFYKQSTNPEIVGIMTVFSIPNQILSINITYSRRADVPFLVLEAVHNL